MARTTGTKGTNGSGFPAIAIVAVGLMAITSAAAVGIVRTLGVIIGTIAITIAIMIATTIATTIAVGTVIKSYSA